MKEKRRWQQQEAGHLNVTTEKELSSLISKYIARKRND